MNKVELCTGRASGRLGITILTALVVALSGCIDISAQLQPINESVMADKTNSDCAGILFGFGFGDLSVERALTKVQRVHDPLNLSGRPIEEKVSRITKIRSVRLHDISFLFFGERCVEVTGE